MSETTVQWKDKQQWSADQLIQSCQSIFLSLPFFASCWRDSSAHRMDPLVSSTFSSVMGPDILGTGTKQDC